MRYLITVITGICILYGCAPKPYAASNKIYKKKSTAVAKQLTAKPQDSVRSDSVKYPVDWAGTTNFSVRKPNFVILHHTAQNSCEQTLKTFTLERTQVSSHYVICKDGTLHHMLNDYLRGWHAGSAKWGSVTDINSVSIGIEMDNNGTEPYTEAQLNVLTGVLANLKKAHNIPTANFIGHGDIAPGRKVDPDINFPWKRFADAGFGHWYGDTTGLVIPAEFNPLYALRIIGYDISKPAAVVEAFRRHFISVNRQGELTDEEKKVLFALMQKYL